MGKTVGFEIGDHSVKLVYFAGKELKKAVSVALPDAMVSHGRILSMDAMADFLREAAKANGIPSARGADPFRRGRLHPRGDGARHDGAAVSVQPAL